jgi:hypothetical protein
MTLIFHCYIFSTVTGNQNSVSARLLHAVWLWRMAMPLNAQGAQEILKHRSTSSHNTAISTHCQDNLQEPSQYPYSHRKEPARRKNVRHVAILLLDRP